MNSRSARKNLFELLWIAVIVTWACLSTQVLFGVHQASTGTQGPPVQTPAATAAPHPVEGETFVLRNKPPMPSSPPPANTTRPHSQRSSAPTAKKSSSREKPHRTVKEP
jgi:hypothetical protein